MVNRMRFGFNWKPGTFGVLLEWYKFDDEKSLVLRLPWILVYAEWGEPMNFTSPADPAVDIAFEITEKYGIDAWTLINRILKRREIMQTIEIKMNTPDTPEADAAACKVISDLIEKHLPDMKGAL